MGIQTPLSPHRTATVQGAHLVGSINFPDAETTFRAAAGTLGDRLKRIPDGEVGDRFHWIAFQPDILATTLGILRVGDEPILLKNLDQRQLTFADGVDIANLELPPLQYASSALESWEVFRGLRDEGVIPAHTRFQVSLPTPAAVITAYVVPEHRAAFEPVYEAAIFAELDEILAGIPHDSLAIQWDTAVEFGLIEAADYGREYAAFTPWWDGDIWTGVIERAVRQAARVPDGVEVGYHLCYGDVAEKHFIEPKDAGNLVRFITKLLSASPRPITWFHLPVPIERDDAAYFAPLAALELPADTELYLGLVHREDGVEGATRREAAAAEFVTRYGVATECGCGRAPEDATVPLLETHREVTAAW
jgi:hypothetical protein